MGLLPKKWGMVEFDPPIEKLYVNSRLPSWIPIGRIHILFWIVMPITLAAGIEYFGFSEYEPAQRFLVQLSLLVSVFLAVTFTKLFKRWHEPIYATVSTIFQIGIMYCLVNYAAESFIIAAAPLIFIMMFSNFFMHPSRHKYRVISAAIIMIFQYYLLLKSGMYPSLRGGPVLFFLYCFGTAIIGIIHSNQFDTVHRKQFLLDLELAVEKDKSEKILFQVLPPAIAEKLKSSNHKDIAQYHNEAVVFFADLKGFTAWSSDSSAHTVVSMLEFIFDKFDDAANQFGVQKIKTIGDAYMAAAGVLDSDENMAVNMGQFAQQALSEFELIKKEYDLPLDLRIGIHLGPVVSGVIGKKLYTFDVWGPTVNFASRLESIAEPGTIFVSSEFYNRTNSKFEYSEPESKTIKGIGKRNIYKLKSSTEDITKSA